MSLNVDYRSIKDLSETKQNDNNFYAVIYDATFPTQDTTPNNYICMVKVIDYDVNCLSYPNSLNENLLNIIIKSNCKENLPNIHNVGDILRIQKGIYVIYFFYILNFKFYPILIIRNPKTEKTFT